MTNGRGSEAGSTRVARPPRVEAHDLTVTYRGRRVLDVPEITIESGHTYALLGASGAGKSTLLRVLGLLEKPSTGTVAFDGVSLDPGRLSTRRRIAAVFQKPFLMRGTVRANVEYGLKLRGVASDDRRQRVAQVLERVRMPGWENQSVNSLSGGEAQRIALARALVLEPELLLLDEPLSYLDPLLKRELLAEFAEVLLDAGLTALYVTHDPDEAAVVADRMGIMRDGRIVAEGSPESVLTVPRDEWVAAFLGAQIPFAGTVVSCDERGTLVECSGVTLRASAIASVGSSVLVGIRPESVTLHGRADTAPPAESFNQLACSVQAMRPGGTSVFVSLSDGELTLDARVPSVTVRFLGLVNGMTVIAAFPPEAVFLEPR